MTNILQEADRLVNGARQSDYGHPSQDFARTGRIWGALLEEYVRTAKPGDPVPPYLVGLCMAGVKMSRHVNRRKTDNMVDLAGYAQTVQMCDENDKK